MTSSRKRIIILLILIVVVIIGWFMFRTSDDKRSETSAQPEVIDPTVTFPASSDVPPLVPTQ